MICETCLGKGRIPCGACWGGQKKAVCPDCLGKGEITNQQNSIIACKRCHGSGRIIPQSCPVCGNSLPCPKCQTC